MSDSVHLIIPDPHAHPNHHNDRADWLGQLILDLKPDVVVNLGDMWDMPSMASYDKGKKSFQGRTFKADIDAGLEFDDRMWAPIRRAKKRRPRAIFIEGNHEYRLKRAIDLQPELDGVISFDDLDLSRNYDDVVEYTGGTPGIIEVDGVVYCHYATSGVMGRPIGGEHPAYSLLSKQFQSVTQGHIHVFNHCTRTNIEGRRIHGLIAGVYQDYDSDWAGEINKLWSRGVVIKRGVSEGNYDLEWISIDRLKEAYSDSKVENEAVGNPD